MNINNFLGDLSEISAKTATLVVTHLLIFKYMLFVCAHEHDSFIAYFTKLFEVSPSRQVWFDAFTISECLLKVHPNSFEMLRSYDDYSIS